MFIFCLSIRFSGKKIFFRDSYQFDVYFLRRAEVKTQQTVEIRFLLLGKYIGITYVFQLK